MKLNKTRTTIVGLAFMTIMLLGQLYNSLVPLILELTFKLNDLIAGFIMAADNILALFLLPIFGMLSDKTNSKLGKRLPYILIGSFVSSIMLVLLVAFDTPTTFVPFIITVGIMLLAMSIYRSPAVAIMPDITPTPLLSKGNAVINLMGATGGIIAIQYIKILSPEEGTSGYLLSGVAAATVVLIVIILLIFVKENKWRKENNKNFPVKNEEHHSSPKPLETLSKEKKKSFTFLLSSVFLWFFGYNAIESAYSKYAVTQWGLSGGAYADALTVAAVAAIISYIPIGMLATRIGRKRTILIGISLLFFAFVCISMFRVYSNILLLFFILAGFGIAAINVNSYPMFVSLGKGSDIGKYTGYYYTASMASQIVTPMASGALLEYVGYWTLFPYAALFVALSAVTMIFVKHGDSRPKKLESKIEAFDVED